MKRVRPMLAVLAALVLAAACMPAGQIVTSGNVVNLYVVGPRERMGERFADELKAAARTIGMTSSSSAFSGVRGSMRHVIQASGGAQNLRIRSQNTGFSGWEDPAACTGAAPPTSGSTQFIVQLFTTDGGSQDLRPLMLRVRDHLQAHGYETRDREVGCGDLRRPGAPQPSSPALEAGSLDAGVGGSPRAAQ
jgi:hypothetical protein